MNKYVLMKLHCIYDTFHGCKSLEPLRFDDRYRYNSYHSVNNMLNTISGVIRADVTFEVKSLELYVLHFYESIDVNFAHTLMTFRVSFQDVMKHSNPCTTSLISVGTDL